jgi:hypothetical protein
MWNNKGHSMKFCSFAGENGTSYCEWLCCCVFDLTGFYVFFQEHYVIAVSYTTAVTRKSPASHLPWSSSRSPSCFMMFSQYRSLTSTPVMDNSEDPSLYKEHKSFFTVGMDPVRMLVRATSNLCESPCHFTKVSQTVCQMGHSRFLPAISK